MQHCVHGHSKVPCFFIFGDSLSDVGNNNHLNTLSKSNYKPFGIDFPTGPTGRYTDNRTGADIITELLGFSKFIPPYANTTDSNILKGVNYASGGAGIHVETGSKFGEHISLGQQIANHRVIVYQIAHKLGGLHKAIQYLTKCLYYVNMGTNDYEVNYFLPNSTTRRFYTPKQYAENLISYYSIYLQELRHLGARKYVLNGLSPLGCIPIAISTHGRRGCCVGKQNIAASIFNDKLKSLVKRSNIKYSADSKFIYVNIYAIFQTFGKSNGFTDTTTPCCPSNANGFCIPNQTPCKNRDQYVYYDGIHASDAANRLIAINSYNASNPSYTYPMDIKHLIQSC
ncbi:hypothetical protein VNO77_34077 [Canavalia gladiata]|uniref:Uncharacterized protein n=1 Tax=Canavalia gladiata TaxID=3824 RepID=A0AAN9KF01_CANGL